MWNNVCKLPVVRIKWSTVFNNGGASDPKAALGASKFMNRLCEFFAIDTSEDYYIFNLTRNRDKPARVINFGQKHSSLGRPALYTQS